MPPLRVVYAESTLATATPEGIPVSLRAGDAWDATDPLVLARPDLFVDEPPIVRRSSAQMVEAATAAPGEVRGARRRA